MKSLLKSKWLLPLLIGVLLTSTLALSLLVGSAHTRAASADRVLHVFEHATPGCCKSIIVSTPPDLRGNYFVFYEPVFDATDTHQIGHSSGMCVNTSNTVLLCQLVYTLQEGQITVQGPGLTDGTPVILSITGGTGSYTGAQGWEHSLAIKNGTEFEDFFHLV